MKDETTLKRLVLVKRLYLEGVDKAARQHNYSDQLLSVINLFLAVETLMGAVILVVEEQPGEAIGTRGYTRGRPSSEQVSNFKLGDYHKFEQLFDQVVAILRDNGSLGNDERLFNWGSLERLQKARNDAQHGAKAPHLSDLPELSTVTKGFIERILELEFFNWGPSLADISLADLIDDDVLQNYIKKAETALTKGQIDTCALLVQVAFLLGRKKRRFDWWRERTGQIRDDFDASHQISRDWGFRRLDNDETRLLSNIMNQVLKLPNLYDNWLLGLDSVDRSRLWELTPRLIHYPENMHGSPPSDEVSVLNLLDGLISGETNWTGPHFQKIPSKDECLWVLDFTIETLLRWQREQQGRFTPIASKYSEALTMLESIADKSEASSR